MNTKQANCHFFHRHEGAGEHPYIHPAFVSFIIILPALAIRVLLSSKPNTEVGNHLILPTQTPDRDNVVSKSPSIIAAHQDQDDGEVSPEDRTESQTAQLSCGRQATGIRAFIEHIGGVEISKSHPGHAEMKSNKKKIGGGAP